MQQHLKTPSDLACSSHQTLMTTRPCPLSCRVAASFSSSHPVVSGAGSARGHPGIAHSVEASGGAELGVATRQLRGVHLLAPLCERVPLRVVRWTGSDSAVVALLVLLGDEHLLVVVAGSH